MDFIGIVSGLSVLFYFFHKKFPILKIIKKRLEYTIIALFIGLSIYSYYFDRSIFIKMVPYCKNNPFLPGFDTIYKMASKYLLDNENNTLTSTQKKTYIIRIY